MIGFKKLISCYLTHIINSLFFISLRNDLYARINIFVDFDC